MVLLVRHVDALEAVDVPGQAGLVDVSLAGLDGLDESVVNENVLKISYTYSKVKITDDELLIMY
jgi:hypothetical protein